MSSSAFWLPLLPYIFWHHRCMPREHACMHRYHCLEARRTGTWLEDGSSTHLHDRHAHRSTGDSHQEIVGAHGLPAAAIEAAVVPSKVFLLHRSCPEVAGVQVHWITAQHAQEGRYFLRTTHSPSVLQEMHMFLCVPFIREVNISLGLAWFPREKTGMQEGHCRATERSYISDIRSKLKISSMAIAVCTREITVKVWERKYEACHRP